MISSLHLSPFSDAYIQLFYSTSPLSYQICILNITHPNVNSWFPQSMLLSQFSSFQLISTPFFQLLRQLLKNFESIIQKEDVICSILFLLALMSKHIQPNSSFLHSYYSDPHHHLFFLLDYCNVLLISSLLLNLLNLLNLSFALTF